MRVVCISDTHGHFPVVPRGDVLVHTGDYSKGRGSHTETLQFYRWLGSLPFEYIVTTPGNHDIIEQDEPDLCAEIALNNNVYRLVDQSVTVNGLKFYGSPWQPSFGHSWAFNLPRGSDAIKKKWSEIPKDTNVLLTHGPPEGILDLTRRLDHAGCSDLANRALGLLDLKLHVFGHIHESYGMMMYGPATFVNASTCSLRYTPDHEPIVIDL